MFNAIWVIVVTITATIGEPVQIFMQDGHAYATKELCLKSQGFVQTRAAYWQKDEHGQYIDKMDCKLIDIERR